MPADTGNYKVDKTVAVLPFDDSRTSENIGIAFSEPLAKLLPELFVEKMQNYTLFKKAQMLPESNYYNKKMQINEKTITDICRENKADLLMRGNIYEFSSNLKMVKYIPSSFFSQQRSKYKITFTIKGHVVISNDKGEDILNINIDKTKTYAADMYPLYDEADMNSAAMNDAFLIFVNKSDFDEDAEMFLFEVADELAANIMELKTAIYAEKLKYRQEAQGHLYYPPENTLAIPVEKVKKMEGQKNFTMLAYGFAGGAIGSVIALAPYSKDLSSGGLFGIGLAFLGGTAGAFAGCGIGFLAGMIIIDPKTEKNLIYADNGTGSHMDVPGVHKNFEW